MNEQAPMRHEKSCGAVVYRREGGQLLVLVEHMALGHCSIPKGHVEPGETEEETARREIREETALEVRLDTRFRRTVTYSPAPGVSKDVVFFVAEALGTAVREQESEVSRAEFLPADQAMAAMTYDSDRAVIAAARDYLREI